MGNTTLTLVQQQRMEALNAGAALLVDRSVSPSSLFTKGNDSAMKASAMFATDVPAAIALAEYIISGVDTPPRRIVFTEDGPITTYEDA